MSALSSWFARKLFGVDARKTIGVDSQADGQEKRRVGVNDPGEHHGAPGRARSTTMAEYANEEYLSEQLAQGGPVFRPRPTPPPDNEVDFGDARPGEFASAEGLTLEQEEWVEGVNVAVERHAREILSLALRFFSEGISDDFEAAVENAKDVWLSLLSDPDVSRCAAQLPAETEAARLLLQRLGGRLP